MLKGEKQTMKYENLESCIILYRAVTEITTFKTKTVLK